MSLVVEEKGMCMTASSRKLVGYGVGVALGLLVAGFAYETYHWYGYMQANPAVGAVSTSPLLRLSVAVMFLVGATLAFVSFARGMALALDDTGP